MEASSEPNLRTFWDCVYGEMFLDCQAAISMCRISGLACADFALFARSCAARGTTGHQGLLSAMGRPMAALCHHNGLENCSILLTFAAGVK